MTELDAIRSSGGSWGVFMVENSYGNYLDVIGTRDPNATCGFVGDASTGTFQCSSHPGYGFVRAEQFAYNTYADHGCGYWVNVCSNDGMFLNTEPVVVTNTAGYEIWGAPVSQLPNYTFYAMHFNTTYPDGYAGTIIPTSPPPATYVAMGDSFSSGEGNPPFEADTNTSTDQCHRSPAAYPRLLENDASLSLGATAFVACSGATTNEIINANAANNEQPQINALSDSTQVVTITIGGNDIGFANVIQSCANLTDDCDGAINQANSNLGIVGTALTNVYLDILQKAPNAKVYVLGYPPIITASTGPGCAASDFPFYDDTRRQKAATLLSSLDSTIQNAVNGIRTQTGNLRINYVDPLASSSPFTGHDLCSSSPDFNGIVNPTVGSFHPNGSGQLAYDNLVSYAITGGIA